MTYQPLRDVLESTGYLTNGQPAQGVHLDDDARSRCRTREFSPDAMWRSESALTVYFKQEQSTPPDDLVAGWHREIWNLGIVPLLWVISPDGVDIYNGFGRPKKAEDAAEHRLDTFGKIASELNRLDDFAGRLAMETGQFWQQVGTVDRKTSVDRQLLSDLAAVERDLMAEDLNRSSAQALIGRSIFTQYLIDREIITSEFLKRDYGHSALASVLRHRRTTERLFNWLRDTFNGDMFMSMDSSSPASRHLRRVADFLDAVDPETGQRTLFPYQFDVIPVELISTIYEQFAHSNPSSEDTEPETDVYYTRLSLVSLILDEIMEGLTGEEVVLDMTCGSGVFLVEALRKLVALRSGSDEPRRETIRSTLHQQIYGMDISDAAVRVAAFSLYLAALELDPDPQPPEALRFKPLIGKTLIVGDARDVENTPKWKASLTERNGRETFDVIVGNPPWSYPGKADPTARRPRRDRSGVFAPRGESLNFVARAMEFASDDTRFGLVLNGVQFFSRSETGAAAVRHIIEKLSPVTLVNLSYQSQWLFSHGNLPAIVLLAKRQPSHRGKITAVQVPWSPASARTHAFDISRDDVLTLPLADWRKRPEFLKAAFFGLRRDLALLDRLITKHAFLSDHLKKLDTGLHAGLMTGNRNRDSSFLHGLPLLTRRDLRPLSIPENLSECRIEKAERPRKRDIYRAPLLLVKEFLKSDGRLVTAVSERDIVYNNAVFGAPLPDIGTARLLAAILSSSLASWFVLMTASTFGLWMQRVLLRDIEPLPIPDLETALRSEFGRRLTRLVRKLQRAPSDSDDWRTLDEAVFDLYGLDGADRIVVRDGLFRARWQWRPGRLESVAGADTEHVLAYAKAFLAAIDVWLSALNRRRMRAEVFDLPMSAPLRVVRFVLEERPGPSVAEVAQPQGQLRGVLHRIGERLDLQLGTTLVGQRALRAHAPDEVVVIKPAALRHWMGVSALEDADATIAESVSGTVA